MPKSTIVLIGGGHSAGKRTVAELLKEKLLLSGNSGNLKVDLVDLEAFNRSGLTSVNKGNDNLKGKNIGLTNENDVIALKPSRFDFEAIRNHLADKCLKVSKGIHHILLVHGLYALYDKQLRSMSQIKVFVACDPDTRLIRWITRDVLNKGERTLDEVLSQYLKRARLEMSDFIFPTKEFADIILPGGAEGNALNPLVDGIVPFLAQGDPHESRTHLVETYLRPKPNDIFKERFDSQKGKFYEVT